MFQGDVNLFIAVSIATKENLISSAKIDSKKIKVLYNCINIKKFIKKESCSDLQLKRDKIGIGKDAFVVGYAGRLIRYKGWREFINSIKLILKSCQNFKFLVAGDGPDRKKMLNLIEELKLRDNVVYLGHVENMNWFYKLLDCYVRPSYWEPMGISAIEAQACGVAVIASDVGGLNEIINDMETGLLCNPVCAQALAEKIKTLYANKGLRNKLIKNAFKYLNRYSLDKYVEELNLIYERI